MMYSKLFTVVVLSLGLMANTATQKNQIRKQVMGTWLLTGITESQDYYNTCNACKYVLQYINDVETVPDRHSFSSLESYQNYLKKNAYEELKERHETYKVSLINKYQMIMQPDNRVINVMPGSRDTSYWYTERQDSVFVYDPARIGKEGDITRFLVEYIAADSMVMRRIDYENEKVYYHFKKRPEIKK